MVHATRAKATFQASPHALAWIALGLLVFLQPPGQVAADTKLDLLLDPAGFLSGALHAWTDVFTLGQLQNQAYGYLFPQGLFFLLSDPLPDWIAQRLWWWLVVGVGFSGFFLLVKRLKVGTTPFQFLAALLFALSPRTLTTLTAISSETWPIMVAPWVCLPLLKAQLNTRAIALSLIPAAAMGAVNATATLAALVPAALIVIYRRAPLPFLFWSLGILAVNAWWIGPLLVLGKYAPPFTEFIESASVTTTWLNPIEIIRGTTSWTPFVDTERQAGYLLVNESLFVMLSVLVAALGLTGLVLLKNRGLWAFMLAIGVCILGVTQFGVVQDFLDGIGAAFRNIHKFDLLIRMPLMVGIASLGHHLSLPASLNFGRRQAVGILVILIGVGSIAPAWSGRLLPQGSWDEVPDYWYEATEFINQEAAGTRTLIAPSSPFARQDWGWTRDEPAQPLLDVPWAVRDAIPLIPPEAIRGLDGLNDFPSDEALKSMGIGAVLVRHDLEADPKTPTSADIPGSKHTFGEVDVYLIDPNRDMMIADYNQELPKVAGGGEILALLDGIGQYQPRILVDRDADIVTDTPQLVGTNYGDGSSSAALASVEETEVKNRLIDYPSAGPLTMIKTEGSLKVSSSGSDATSFGGADPDRSMTSMVDSREDTAWYPTPGDTSPWIEVDGSGTSLKITPNEDVTITVRSGNSVSVRDLLKGEPTTFRLPESQARIELAHFAGISELEMAGVSRTITVPNTSPEVNQFLFQRMTVPTAYLDRAFIVPSDMQVDVEAESCSDIELDGHMIDCGPLELTAGQHMLRSDAEWVSMGRRTASISISPFDELLTAPIDRIVLTGRAFNEGMQARINGEQLQPIELDAAAQGFVIPAGISGDVEFIFDGERPYRISLFTGAAIALFVVMGSLWMARRRENQAMWQDTGNAPWAVLLLIPAFGIWLLPAALSFVIVRFTLIPRWVLSLVPLSIAGLWLSHAPWPSAAYPAEFWGIDVLVAVSVLSVFLARTQCIMGASTKE